MLFKTQYQFLTKAFYVFVIDPSRVNVYTNGLFGALTPFIDYLDIDGKNPGRSSSPPFLLSRCIPINKYMFHY